METEPMDGQATRDPSTTSDYRLLSFDTHQIQQSIVPVVSWNGATLTCHGTAFAVHEAGIFLTARHVVDEWVADFAVQTHDGTAGLFILFESDIMLAPTASEPEVEAFLGGPLAVVGVHQHPHSDLALLQAMQPYHEGVAVPYPPLPLSFGLPSLGQSCTAVGYPKMSLTGDVPVRHNAHTPIQVDYERQLAVSKGTIEDIHPVRRDGSLLAWPCFLTVAPYPRGVSGAAVLNDAGQVIGVVCSSTEGDTEVDVASYASLIAPALALKVPIDSVDPARTLAELVAEGSDLEDVDVADVEGILKTVYTPEAIAREGLG